MGWPQATHSAIVSYVAQSTSSPSTASAQLYFLWDSSKGKSTGSDHLLTYKRYYNLVSVLRRTNLGWPPAPHWATISCVALSTPASTSASDQLFFDTDESKAKSNGSDHLLNYTRYYNLVCVLKRSNWAGRRHHIGPPYHV